MERTIKRYLIALIFTLAVAGFGIANTTLAQGKGDSAHGLNAKAEIAVEAKTSCPGYIDKYLRIGYNNDPIAVVKLQIFLNSYMNAGLVTDGIYGPLTEAAVKNFQLVNAETVLTPWNITEPTGIFYLTTQTEVNKIICEDASLSTPSPLVNWSINNSIEKPEPNPGTTALYLDITGGRVLGEETYRRK